MTKSKTPTREWLLGWFDGSYYASFTTEGYERHMKNLKKRSKATLLKLYLQIRAGGK